MNVLHCIGFVWFFYLIYRFFFKPIKTVENLFERGVCFSLFGLKKKEIELYQRALTASRFTAVEKRDISFTLGVWYAKAGDWAIAASYFDQSFDGYDAVFYYRKEFNHVLDAYLASSQKEKAQEMLRFFLSRKSFDRQFAKLEKKYSLLL